MKKGTTLFLKIAVFLIGTPVLAVCVSLLVILANDSANPDYAKILYPIVFGMYVAAIPFFYALFQSLKLLSYIDNNKAFSELSVTALKKIKYSAFTISIVYVFEMPFFFMLGEKDDAPGIIVIGSVLIFASLVIALFAGVLHKLLKEAIDIKSENDLTV